ncbi:MAG: response regulator transcription factor [Candidatus Nanopelagicales bacterium]|jgi:DNA-binding response OmpR family regulator|nr:response regulator transcription factor [Candidatus Nanopelagicales bacterium]
MAGEHRGLVLVAEDERPIADLLGMYLRREGFGVEVALTGPDALAAARRLQPVALVLDVGLPGMDGTEVCRTLRAEGDGVPILFCTARDDEVDRVLGLELGADDYITKPFSPREVVARVKAVLRRVDGSLDETDRPLVLGDVELSRARHRVTVRGEPVELTATEFDLLAHLMARPGRVVTRDQLLSAVWGYAAAGGTRTVDVHVAQVRAKLGDASPIRTVRGVGYSADAG